MLRPFALTLLFGLGLPLVPASAFDQSHARLGEVLRLHVKDGLVDYRALTESPETLDSYLSEVAAVEEAEFERWTEAERLALLINLYNAATLRLIIDHYPVESIRKIGWLPGAAWKQEVVRLHDRKITLDHLEHGILRKQYRDARVHFALVCAAHGCPPLRAEPYTAEQLDQQLDEQGRVFLSQSNKNRFDLKQRTAYLSPIFKWFAEDFVAESGSVLEFVADFVPTEVSQALASEPFTLRYTDYDWSLNDRSQP